jgi:hypothetical protein
MQWACRKDCHGFEGHKDTECIGSCIDGPNCRNCIASDAPNQVIQEVIKLKHLVRISRNFGSFGNRTHVGSCGRSAHANSNVKYEC